MSNMKALWWDDIDGRRELATSVSGIGWGLLIGALVALSLVLDVMALVTLFVALLIRLHVMREAQRRRPGG
jgi:uncharacterized protein (DUF58 family)